MIASLSIASALFTNASAIYPWVTKLTSLNKNQFTPKDLQLIQGIERRINSLVQPLNICLMRNDAICKPAI